MVGRIPVLHGNTTAASVMACGYNPDVACWSPFHGAMYAVIESVVRAVALGADPAKLRLTLQEYFRNCMTARAGVNRLVLCWVLSLL